MSRSFFFSEKRHIPGPFEYNCGGDIIWKHKTISMKGRSKCFTEKEGKNLLVNPLCSDTRYNDKFRYNDYYYFHERQK